MKTPVAPFSTVRKAVTHGGWKIQVREALVELPLLIEDWDYQSRIRLVAGIRADGPGIAEEAGLLPMSEVDIVVQVRSSNTKIQRTVFRTAVPLENVNDILCDLEFDGDDLGDRLTIQTMLVARVPLPIDGLGATRPASILWQLSDTTQLEGDGGQFPTDAEDFAITRPTAAHAGWFLTIDMNDMTSQFVSAVRVTLNSGLKPVQKILADISDDQTKLLLSALDFDVTRQLVQAALASDDVIGAEPDADSTSLQGVLRTLLARLWPSTSPLTLQNWVEERPELIELAIQNATRFPS